MKASRSGEPHSRLTRLCAAMTAELDRQPEMGDDVKCAVFLQDGERGGIQLHGYESEVDAMVDIFIHLKALFEANGKTLAFMPMPGQG